MKQYFTYRGRLVTIVRTADLPKTMRPDGRFARFVQHALNTVPEWEQGEDPIETLEFDEAVLPAMAIPTKDRQIVWGVHVGHKARTPGLSPFMDDLRGVVLSNELTLELAGTPDAPLLTRGYAGKYTPPLPWMNSARSADGGQQFCLEYWQTHGYVSPRLTLIRPGTKTYNPPLWFGR
jgi:hypothetical protein